MRLREEIRRTSKRKWNSYAEDTLFPESLEGASSKIQRCVVENDDSLHREFLLAFSSRYSEDKDFNLSPVPDTCTWFLEDPKFCDWRDSENSCFLWISAGPDCGKSVLSKHLVDERLVSHRAIRSTIC